QLLPRFQEERWAKVKTSWQSNPDTLDWLSQIGIKTWTGDARQLPYPEAHIPLIHSNNTFEHIPRPILQGIMQELKRVLSSEGVMSHYIDMADHYSYGDASIGPFHFLRFAERSWSWLENPFQAQNRMRISQYAALFEELGLVCDWSEIERGSEAELQCQSIALPFQNMDSEDLRVLYAQAILKH
ncbi:MAG: class I SAM-dependent methyltransferase, partial [Bacteroidota bacterium]